MVQLNVSPAEAFRPKTEALRLPSGHVVAVRECDLIGLLVSGGEDVPDFISSKILAGMNANGARSASTDIVIDKDNVGDVLKFIDRVIMASVVSPQVVKVDADYEAGQICINDLGTPDKMHIFNVTMPQGDADAALSFRKRVEAANLAVVPDGKDDGDEAEPDTRSKK